MLGTHSNSGKLELILGCMFSGKSTELIKRYRKYQEAAISSHDFEHTTALACSELNSLIGTREFKDSAVILIDEGQFFKDLYEFCKATVEEHGKHLVISGLDGDFKREPIGDILRLIPLADSVDRLSAICLVCKNGTRAIFSKRLIEDDSVTLVGGVETYLPVCRQHFLE